MFTTDCRLELAWWVHVLFHSANAAGHTCPITQIACGCEDDPALRRRLLASARAMYPRARVHFAPDPYVDPEKLSAADAAAIVSLPDRYRATNRPLGVAHWLAHGTPRVDGDTPVMILQRTFLD